MRFVAETLFAVSLLACATTSQKIPMVDPKSGEIVRDGKGEIVLSKVDSHDYLDPLGHGQRDAADAEYTKANATAVKVMAEACLESVQNPPRAPSPMGGTRMNCAKGGFMEEVNGGWNYFGPGMTSPYFMPYGGMMNGGYQPYYNGMMMQAPTSSLLPMSSVSPGTPQVVTVFGDRYRFAANERDTTKWPQQHRAENPPTQPPTQELVMETPEEKAAGAKLVKDVAKCTSDRDLKDTQDCQNKVVALEAYQDSLRKLKRINESMQLARNDVDGVRVTGGSGSDGAMVSPGSNMSVSPSGNRDIATPAVIDQSGAQNQILH